jgi:hypothetical protein
MRLFSFYPQACDVTEAPSLVPTTALSKTLKMKIFKISVLLFILYATEAKFLSSKEIHTLQVFENRVRRIYLKLLV